jgi:aminopeptidase
VENVQLKFKQGKVVEANADKNEEFLRTMIATDEGASYLGEFGLGTNFGIQKFTKQMLFDEKIGGTFHLALGLGFAETGGKNKSGIHWDLICELGKDGQIIVDGEPFYKDGKFTPWG